MFTFWMRSIAAGRLLLMLTTDAALLRQIGLNVKAERARRNLTQEGLARIAGLGPAQVARMERGEMDTGITKYLHVARALGIDPAALFHGMNNESVH